MERRLGKGLGALLGERGPKDDAASAIELPLDRIRPNPNQPRRTFEDDALRELSQSLRQHGVLQPICVRTAGDRYEIVSGERRFRAAHMAGLKTLPVVIREGVSDDEMLELALVENIQREDLDAIEKAQAYRELTQRLGLTQEQVAQRVGKQRATVTNHLRLLELPEKVQEAVSKGLIGMGHARALLGLKQERTCLTLLARTVRDDLSVRQVEAAVRATAASNPAPGHAGASTVAERTKVLQPAVAWVTELEKRIREGLGTQVRIQNGKGYRGQIVIRYNDRAELDRLCARLAPRPELE